MTKDTKFNVIKQWIEDLVETRNWIIQIVYFLTILFLFIAFDLQLQKAESVIVELLFVLSGELYILSIKDSLMQKKINRLGAQQDIRQGRLFQIANFNIDSFFNNAKDHLFISGMALNGFFSNSKCAIEKLMENRKKLCVLIAEPKMIIENAKLCFGEETDPERIIENAKRVINFEMETIETILGDYKDNFEQGNIELRLSSVVFSTSFVAYDCITIGTSRVGKAKEIKASFYQYGCRDMKQAPNILIRSNDQREWYNFFAQTLKRQWNNAKKIRNIDELKALLLRLEEQKAEFNI